jgi:predicted KAP-like P-loop ATPase
MMRGALKIGVRAGTGGALDGSEVDIVEKGISKLLDKQVDTVVTDRLKSAAKDKIALEDFRKYLEGFAQEHGEGMPIVFIIDELDRCRPDFALDLIEQIKHLFSVPGITFLLILNRKQLEKTVELRYGGG